MSHNYLLKTLKRARTIFVGARLESPKLMIYITASNSANIKDLEAAVEGLHFSGVVVNAVSRFKFFFPETYNISSKEDHGSLWIGVK